MEHRHTELTHGCYRCELGAGEEQSAILDQLWDERWMIANAYGTSAVREAYGLLLSSLDRYAELAVWVAEQCRRVDSDTMAEPVLTCPSCGASIRARMA